MTKLFHITGKAIPGEWGDEDLEGTGVPVLRTTNFTNEGVVNFANVVTRKIAKKDFSEKLLQKGDIIIEKSGGSDKFPVGRVVFFEGPEHTYLFNNFTGLLRVQDPAKWLSRYVFYALFANYRKGGTRPYENKTTGLHNLQTEAYVNALDIPDCDQVVQSRICQILDGIQNILRFRRTQLSALDTLVKSRFVEMFGDNVDWPETTIAAVCQHTRTGPFGSALHHDEFVESGIFVLGIDNAVENRFTYNRMRFITPVKYEQLKRYTVHPGDVLITIMGTIGRSAVIPPDMPTAINTKHLACLTPNREKVDSTFLCHAFQTHPGIRAQLAQQTKGAIMAGLNLTIINGLKFKLPPLALQKQFSAFVARVNNAETTIQRALSETQRLFDSLMQEYFG